MDIIPLNPIDALAKGSMLQVIFFAIMFGFGLSMLGEKGRPAFAFFDACAETMINVTTMVMKYAPISVFGLMTFTVAKHGLNVLLPLGKLLLVMYLVAFLQITLVYLPCAKYAGHGPKSFFSGIMEPLMIAFATTSSAAALTSNMMAVQKMGASRAVSSFSIPLGNTINMDGAPSIWVWPLFLLLKCMASPCLSISSSTMVFTQVGIPREAVPVIAGVDRVMDMARTSINVLGDATGALFVTKWEGPEQQEC